MDYAEGVEPVKRSESYSRVKLDIIIKGEKEVKKEKKKNKPGLVFWTNGSKLDQS